MYKSNKKLYYKLFDLYRYKCFINDESESNRLIHAMLNVKKYYNTDLKKIDEFGLKNIGFDSLTISDILEFFSNQELNSLNEAVNSHPKWMFNLILSSVFEISDLQYLFNSYNINSVKDLIFIIYSDYFESKFGQIKQKNYLRYLEFVFFDKFPLSIRNNNSILDIDPNFISKTRLNGSFHNHSLYSDGNNSIKELVEEYRKVGKSYLGISDHSKSHFLSGGLSELDIEHQHAEINALNTFYDNFKLFKGIECEILSDGNLDYETHILTKFDYVIVSVHTNLYQSKNDATRRLLKAIENPYTTILGHPTGRCYGRSPGLDVDIYKIIDSCVANNVIIEINGDKDRLDLDVAFINYAEKKGALLSLEADAHSLSGLNSLKYAIFIAEKANLNPGQCLNTFSYEKIRKTFSEK